MITTLLIAASSLTAGKCAFQMKCNQGKSPIVVEFKSVASDCTEDDMQIAVTAYGKSGAIALKPAWYSPIVHMLKTKTDCTDGEEAVAGFFLNETQLLIFITESGRPNYDNVVAALVDVKERTLVDHVDLGKSKETLIPILKTANGFKLRIVRDMIPDVQCDCSAAFTDDWMEVVVKKGKLTTTWMK
jgi:hypothetical protein